MLSFELNDAVEDLFGVVGPALRVELER